MGLMSKDVKSSGVGNIVAGRDISITLKELSEQLGSDYSKLIENRLKEVDVKVNGLFPELVSSPRTKDKNASFSSKRMIASLGLLGIPIDVCLQVLESVIPEFEHIAGENDSLEASHIRRCVANALMKFKSPFYGSQKLQLWTDKYIRRYGNPDQRVEVIFNNGDIAYLDIDFLRNYLIPELINIILSQTKYEDFRKWVTGREIRRMAREILDAVSSLSIYRIHYDSLLQLSRELALQPPHPWLAPRAFDFEAVKYNFYKASKHRKNIETLVLHEDLPTILYSARECAHHSCAAILSYYGIFIGCGESAALNNLISILKRLYQKDERLIEHYSKISVFQRDIDRNRISISSLLSCLDRVKRSFNISPHANLQSIKIYLRHIRNLNDYTIKFISKYVYMNELSETDIDSLNQEHFKCCATKAIELFPKCSIESKKGNHYWITQNMGQLFSHLTSAVLILLSFSRKPNHQRELQIASRSLNRRDILSNAFLIISNRELNREDRKSLRKMQVNGTYGAILSLAQIVGIVTSNDPQRTIMKMIQNPKPNE